MEARVRASALGARSLRALAVLFCAASPHVVGAVNKLGTPISIVGALVALGLLSRSTPGPTLGRLALLVSVSGLALSLGDMVLRPVLRDQLYYRPDELFGNRWPLYPDLGIYQPEARFEGETYGDLSAMHGDPALREARHVVFETDRLGYRNARGLAEGRLDAILLGDSFAAGSGTSQPEIWSERLRAEHGLPTYGIAIPGAPRNELLNLKVWLRSHDLAPGTALVWALFTGNDLEESGGGGFEPPAAASLWRQWRIRIETYRKRSPTRQLAKRVRRRGENRRRDRVLLAGLPGGHELLFYAPYRAAASLTLDEVREHPNHPALAGALDEMGHLAQASGLRVVVAVIPTKFEIYGWLLDAGPPWSGAAPSGFAMAVEELAGRNGLAFLDLEPPLREAARSAFEEDGSLLWWRDDTHWNGRGHALAASTLAPFVRNGR